MEPIDPSSSAAGIPKDTTHPDIVKGEMRPSRLFSPVPVCLLTTLEAAVFLGVSQRTLKRWRQLGMGPDYLRVSDRLVRYRRRDLDTWAEAHRVELKGNHHA